MKYVYWVDLVLVAIRNAKAEAPSIMLSEDATAARLGVADKDHGQEAVGDAVRDLARDLVGAVETLNVYDVKLTPIEGKRLAKRSLRSLWTHYAAIDLDEEQTQFLAALIEQSEARADTHAWLRDVPSEALFAALGWDDVGQRRDVMYGLKQAGLVDGKWVVGDPMIFPTYPAIVKVTEAQTLEDTELIRDLLKRWEGVNVDFKRQLSLKTKDDKAEFIRDVLSLANPQVVADRYIVIGFDNVTRQFVGDVDAKLKQDHMEDVLNEYTESEHSGAPAAVRFRHVAWTDPAGTAGLIEILRAATDVPYRVKKALKGASNEVRLHQIPVRHSSHIAEPDEQELAGLRAEAAWARQMLGLAPVGVRSNAT